MLCALHAHVAQCYSRMQNCRSNALHFPTGSRNDREALSMGPCCHKVPVGCTAAAVHMCSANCVLTSMTVIFLREKSSSKEALGA